MEWPQENARNAKRGAEELEEWDSRISSVQGSRRLDFGLQRLAEALQFGFDLVDVTGHLRGVAVPGVLFDQGAHGGASARGAACDAAMIVVCVPEHPGSASSVCP